MIEFDRFILDNGLRVLVHKDNSTPLAVVNVMYDVGSKDEDENKTGLAHLFEHLMFGGSINIADYDDPLQMAGGENNAYTTHDVTNYYCQLPAQNIETAFWLESDRMLNLAFNKKSLNTQRKVVCEEFKEHYINKPYGNAWHKLRDLAYTTHPYKWMIIGKELSHIQKVQLRDVKEFFSKHYCPANAVLVVSGNVKTEEIKRLTKKWFENIPMGEKYIRELPQEPEQQAPRLLQAVGDVPLDALYKAWHMSSRLEKGYYASDLITEILGSGESSRLYQSLVKEKQLFSNIACHHFGNVEKDLLAIEGKLVKGIKMENAEKAIEDELEKIMNEPVNEQELEKVKNKTESIIAFEDMSIASRANSLAFYEILGNANLMNEELRNYHAITVEDILQYSKQIFNKNNSSTLQYFSKN
ncbi:MAG: M16 family metallopeptidase [Chitinophagaceae bacterium]